MSVYEARVIYNINTSTTVTYRIRLGAQSTTSGINHCKISLSFTSCEKFSLFLIFNFNLLCFSLNIMKMTERKMYFPWFHAPKNNYLYRLAQIKNIFEETWVWCVVQAMDTASSSTSNQNTSSKKYKSVKIGLLWVCQGCVMLNNSASTFWDTVWMSDAIPTGPTNNVDIPAWEVWFKDNLYRGGATLNIGTIGI